MVQRCASGRKDKVLTNLELANEQPHFIHAELVDIGEPFSFCEEFLQGSLFALVNPEERIKTQLCIFADYIQSHEDLLLLKNVWPRYGFSTNQEATFCDIGWGGEQLTVSINFASVPFMYNSS